VETTLGYYQSIEMLEAQELLSALTSHDWPNMKKAQRERLHKKLHKTAYPATYSRPVSVEGLAKILGLGTIN